MEFGLNFIGYLAPLSASEPKHSMHTDMLTDKRFTYSHVCGVNWSLPPTLLASTQPAAHMGLLVRVSTGAKVHVHK